VIDEDEVDDDFDVYEGFEDELAYDSDNISIEYEEKYDYKK